MRKYESVLSKMNKATQILALINNGKLADSILTHITPDFYLNRNNVPSLEE